MAALRKMRNNDRNANTERGTVMSEYTTVEMQRKPVYSTADMAKAGGVKVSTVRMAKRRGEIEPYDTETWAAQYSESELIKFAEARKRKIVFKST
jgi:uncharacterized protein YraI